MTLKQLEYVIEVSNCNSIGEASKKLFVSQPSISRGIMELEKELGIEIFDRTNKGINLTLKGEEFLGYARQVLEQVSLLNDRYFDSNNYKKKFCVSTQHYSFSVNAFIDLFNGYYDKYEFTIRETKTNEIIEDVSTRKSNVGILYLNSFNEKLLTKIFQDNNLEFVELIKSTPHIFISEENPLAKKDSIDFEDLKDYPYLCFEQGKVNSSYYSEEVLNIIDSDKMIKVSDRATLFNLLKAINGYTISTGIIDEKLNSGIIAKKINSSEIIKIGYIKIKKTILDSITLEYIENLKKYLN